MKITTSFLSCVFFGYPDTSLVKIQVIEPGGGHV